jgi:uncharacterized protein DUF1565
VRTTIVSLLVSLAAAHAAALPLPRERWVDAVNGSDATGDGSSAHPWKTLGYAIVFSDVLHVLPGVYDEASGETFPITPNRSAFLSLLGTNRDTTIVRTGTDATLFAPTRLPGLIAEHMTFSRTVPPAGPDSCGLGNARFPMSVQLKDCIVEGHSTGIFGPAVVTGCIIRNNAIAAIRGGLVNAKDCTIQDSSDVGISADGNSSVVDCTIERCGTGLALSAHTFSENTVRTTPLVANSTIQANRTGVTLTSTTYLYCYTSPYIEQCWTVTATVDAKIDANRFFDNEYALESCPADAGVLARVSNSLFEGNGDAVRARSCGTTPGFTVLLVANDTIVANRRTGIVLPSASSRTIVVNSIVTGNPTDLSGVATADVHTSDVGDPSFAGTNGNISADPQFVDPPSRNYRLQATSPCLENGLRESPDPTRPFEFGLDLDGRVRDYDLDGDGVRTPDMGALERVVGGLGPRYGNVAARAGFVQDVLTVDGSTGDVLRVLAVAATTRLTIGVSAPPGGSGAAPFALFAFLGENAANDESHLPAHLGTMCFPTPLSGPNPRVLTLFDNFPAAIRARLATGRLPSTPAPFTAVLPGSASRAGRRVTLQGLIADPASRQGQYAITNAVVVRFQ